MNNNAALTPHQAVALEAAAKQAAAETAAEKAAARELLDRAASERAAAEALRASIRHVEASLEARETKLSESWAALHAQVEALARSSLDELSVDMSPPEALLRPLSSGRGGADASTSGGAASIASILEVLAAPVAGDKASAAAAASSGPTGAPLAAQPLVALESRRAALLERESALRQWAVTLHMQATTLAAFHTNLKQVGARPRSPSPRHYSFVFLLSSFLYL